MKIDPGPRITVLLAQNGITNSLGILREFKNSVCSVLTGGVSWGISGQHFNDFAEFLSQWQNAVERDEPRILARCFVDSGEWKESWLIDLRNSRISNLSFVVTDAVNGEVAYELNIQVCTTLVQKAVAHTGEISPNILRKGFSLRGVTDSDYTNIGIPWWLFLFHKIKRLPELRAQFAENERVAQVCFVEKAQRIAGELCRFGLDENQLASVAQNEQTVRAFLEERESRYLQLVPHIEYQALLESLGITRGRWLEANNAG